MVRNLRMQWRAYEEDGSRSTAGPQAQTCFHHTPIYTAQGTMRNVEAHTHCNEAKTKDTPEKAKPPASARANSPSIPSLETSPNKQ